MDSTHPGTDILQRIQQEFLEMPGLRVTEAQACRLWALDGPNCSAVLSALVNAGFLFRTRNGGFMRIEGAKPVKVEPPGSRTSPKA